MAYALNGDVRIAYEAVGYGPPLVLLHGFGEDRSGWSHKGIADALGGGRSLIMIDARGHGESDKPHDAAAYGIETLVADVVAVLDHAACQEADVLGYSQGGWIALGMAAFAPSRVRRLVIGAATPYGQDLSQYRALVAAGLSTALSLLEKAAGFEFAEPIRAGFLANDLDALRAAYTNDRPDISTRLTSYSKPCLLVCGENDPLLPDMHRLDSAIEQASLVTLRGLNHVQGALRLAVAAEAIDRFLRAGAPRARL